ncbi:hypothetical protein MWSIV6_0740 [Methanothermobacter wolfeii]|nr:hypothetical protein MWSIV6_0740 [Methanothermobacter wolfeii]
MNSAATIEVKYHVLREPHERRYLESFSSGCDL